VIEELDLRVLKTLVNDKVSALTFSSRYDHSLFDTDVQRFAKLVIDYTKHFRSPPTKRTLLEHHGNNPLLATTIEESWREIEELAYDTREYPYDLAQLKKRFQFQAVEDIRVQAASDDPDNPQNPEEYFNNLSLAINRITSIELERTYTQKPVGDYIQEFSESYEARKLNPEALVSIKTGYSMIDAVTGGISPGELVMIGAETNCGKSMLLNNMAKQIWLQGNTIESCASTSMTKGYNIIYFSLEMPYEDCFIRFLASLANVPQRGLAFSTLSHEEELRVGKAKEFIKAYQDSGYYFDIVDVPRNLTIEEVELRYNDALLRYRPDVVVIDYMGLMHSTTLAKEQDWLKLGGIAGSVHEFGRAYDVAMLTAAQLTDLKRSSGSSKSEDSRAVGMHRWGRSSLIMHHVNFGLQIETRHNEINFPDLKIHAVKNRKGPLGQGHLIKNFANASLIDVPYDQSELPGDVSANIPDLIRSIQEAKNKKDG
jgi:energy-coupling factor transporter ATP-binding protein EcfA2